VIGTFQIVGPNKHPSPTRFGKAVKGARLFKIADPAFEQKLRTLRGSEGYQPDPVLRKMTGWIAAVAPLTRVLLIKSQSALKSVPARNYDGDQGRV